VKRAYEHKDNLVEGFTKKFILVWDEIHKSAEAAFTREKQIKTGRRDRNVQLIEKSNPYWNDLYEKIRD
jgi:putative endonuclease